MNKTIAVSTLSEKIYNANLEIQNTSKYLYKIAHDDMHWWQNNIIALAAQPFKQLKNHLHEANDCTLDQWNFPELKTNEELNYENYDAIIWIASLCKLDKLLTNKFPKNLSDHFDLYWRVYMQYN